MEARAAETLLEQAEAASAGATGPNAKASLERLEARLDDLLAAIAWFVDAGRADEALRLTSSLYRFWITKQRFDEGAVWFERVLAAPGGDDRLRGKASLHAGFMPFWLGDDERAGRTVRCVPRDRPAARRSARWSRRRSAGWLAWRCAPTWPRVGGSPAKRSP